MSTTTHRLRALLALLIIGAGLALVAPVPASAAGATIVLDPPATAFTYQDNAVTGTVSPAGATPEVILQWQVDGSWKDIARADVQVSGAFAFRIYPHQRGTYPIRVLSQHRSVVSNLEQLVVKPAPTRVRAGVDPGDITLGERALVSGHVVEPGATPRVVVQRKIGNRWYDRQAGAVDPKTGRFLIKIQPSQYGSYELRVRTNGGSKVSNVFYLMVQVPPMP